MIKGALAIAVVAIVGIACSQLPVTVGAPSSRISLAGTTTTASGPAVEIPALRLAASLQKENPKDDNEITALAESVDGKVIAWGDDKGTVRVHSMKNAEASIVRDLRTVDISKRREIHTIKDLAFDGKGRLWWRDASSGAFYADLGDNEPQIKQVIASPGFDLLSSNLLPWGVIAVKDRFVRMVPKNYLKLFVIESKKDHNSEVIFPGQRGVNELVQHAVRSPDGKLLMAVADGNAALLSLPDMKILRRFGQGWGESAAFSPSSKLVALGTDGRGVFVWETGAGKLVKQIPFRRAAVIDSLVFVGEDVLYAADLPVSRIDLKTGTVAPVAQVNACVLLISRSGDRLFVGTHEGGVEVYDLPPRDARQKQPTTLPTSRATR